METENFSTTFTFDNKGRLSTRTYPSGIVETSNYNNGYLASISMDGSTVWTITGMNERQQITTTSYFTGALRSVFGYDDYGYPSGNTLMYINTPWIHHSYSFDPVTGNLNWRKDSLENLTESFTYDNLDRLLTVTGPQNLTMDYAANGNILTKSDVGTNTFEYNHPTIPYALTDLETASGLVPEDLQTAEYTSFEQVSTIDEGDYDVVFTYNSGNQRCKMVVNENSSPIVTRWYAGSRYMKETAGGATKEYTWIGGDAYSAPLVAITQSGQTSTCWVFRDYLGNIIGAQVGGAFSIDSWGRRRNPDDWSYDLTGEPDLVAGRGFTGHEWLPWFDLINMNGRLYDPVVGRFLSADNYVQMPDFSQSFNRYSYTFNNPLKYTDPNGELPIIPLIAFAVWGGAFNTASHMHDIGSFGEGAGYFFTGAASGALGFAAGQAAAVANTFASGALIGGSGAFGSSLIASGGNALLSGSGFNLNSSLIAGGIGALTGGLAGASNAHMANLESNNLLAYGYTVDVNTGAIQQVSDLGGANTHFYHLGYYTDGGSAFVQLMQTVVEGANTINAFRFWQSAASTISAFSVPASGLTGYFLEPAGPSSNVANSNKLIPAGQYQLKEHWRELYRGKYSLQNSSLLGSRSGILMHAGYTSLNTKGCLLTGCGWSSQKGGVLTKIGGMTSTYKLKQLHSAIEAMQLNKVRVNIFDIY